MSDRLSIPQVVSLGAIVDASHRAAKIARVLDSGDVVYGTARGIGTDAGMSDGKADVRDLFLHVTTRGGMEVFWPVRELMTAHADMLFVVDYEPQAGY